MSSSSDDEPQAQVPVMTVVHARSGADFEAGRGGRARGEHMEGVDVVDPRLPDNSRAGSSGGGAGRSSGGGQQLLNFGQQQPAVAPAAAGQGKQADKKRQMWNGTIKGVPHQFNTHKPEVAAEDQRLILSCVWWR